jgi:hypothetical protein
VGRRKKVEFVMDTDWMFEQPIDYEHKEYKLLSYFQKVGEKIDNMEVYPTFTELSLHLANLQTLIKNKQILYTDKKFKNNDDDIEFKDLQLKNIPPLSQTEYEEFIKILKYSTPKMIDFFNVVKSVWETIFDSITIKLKTNRKNELTKTGYFYYINTENNLYIWEYTIKEKPTFSTKVKLIHNEIKTDLTISEIMFNINKDNKLTVFEMMSKTDFPLENTLLPFFKRKLLIYFKTNSYGNKKQHNVKRHDEDL